MWIGAVETRNPRREKTLETEGNVPGIDRVCDAENVADSAICQRESVSDATWRSGRGEPSAEETLAVATLAPRSRGESTGRRTLNPLETSSFRDSRGPVQKPVNWLAKSRSSRGLYAPEAASHKSRCGRSWGEAGPPTLVSSGRGLRWFCADTGERFHASASGSSWRRRRP
jgi:hypothetical protein